MIKLTLAEQSTNYPGYDPKLGADKGSKIRVARHHIVALETNSMGTEVITPFCNYLVTESQDEVDKMMRKEVLEEITDND